MTDEREKDVRPETGIPADATEEAPLSAQEDREEGAAAAEPTAEPEAMPEAAEESVPAEAGEAPEEAAEAPEEEPAAAGSDEGKEWYILHTYSGFEGKVQQSLRQRAEAYGMADKIGEVLVPTEDVVEVRDGKKVVTKKKFFPGYVLVNMEMSDEAWHVVKNTPKVTNFVGTGSRPTPLTQDEVDRILNHVVVSAEKPKPKYEYRVGDMVKIIDGPFSNFTGVVEEVNEDRSTLKVMVTIFGRSTPVELEFLQVRKPE
jgi:transcriptional antiterminator NusG